MGQLFRALQAGDFGRVELFFGDAELGEQQLDAILQLRALSHELFNGLLHCRRRGIVFWLLVYDLSTRLNRKREWQNRRLE